MPEANENRVRQMAELRALVAEKFPQRQAVHGGRLPTGWEALDRDGGLKKGALTEVCGSCAGGGLVIDAMLEYAARQGVFLALVDAANAFEPEAWGPAQLGRMLWVMAGGVEPALKAADILLRDGNLPIVMLDLQTAPVRELRKVPASTWHRFQRVIETESVVFVVLTPQPMVEGTSSRIALEGGFSLDDRHEPRGVLRGRVEAKIFERGATVQAFEAFARSA
jgi:hypothetical protein